MCKVTIIVPVYKVEKYIDKCLESILSQTYKDFEVALIDDGSPDRCGEICDEYAKKDSRIKVIHKPNGGLADTRNKGVEVAENNGSEYLCFIDSDDYVSDKLLEKTVNVAKETNADIVCFGMDKFDNDEYDKHKKYIHFDTEEVLSGKQIYQYKIISEDYVADKLFKVKTFSGVRFPLGKIYEDMFISYRLLENVKIMATVSDDLYYYRQISTSLSNTVSDKAINDFLEGVELKYGYYTEKFPELKEEALAVKVSGYVKLLMWLYAKGLKNYKDKVNTFRDFFKEKKTEIISNKFITSDRKKICAKLCRGVRYWVISSKLSALKKKIFG